MPLRSFGAWKHSTLSQIKRIAAKAALASAAAAFKVAAMEPPISVVIVRLLPLLRLLPPTLTLPHAVDASG